MTTEAQRLNNAIVRLDWLHGDNAEIAELTRDWRGWYDPMRAQTEGSAAWKNALQFYELRYRAAYARAVSPRTVSARTVSARPVSGEGTPQMAHALSAQAQADAAPKSFPLGLAFGALGMLGLMLVLRKG